MTIDKPPETILKIVLTFHCLNKLFYRSQNFANSRPSASNFKSFSWSLKVSKSQNKFMKLKKNGILLPKLFWTTVRKKCSSNLGKNFKFEAKVENFQKFGDHKNSSNSERSEQFLVTECFFNLFLEISQISKIGKNYWDLEICRKS